LRRKKKLRNRIGKNCANAHDKRRRLRDEDEGKKKKKNDVTPFFLTSINVSQRSSPFFFHIPSPFS
jgi:hypothetical protein